MLLLDEMHILKMVVKFCTKLSFTVFKKMYCFRENSNFPFSNKKSITLVVNPTTIRPRPPSVSIILFNDIFIFYMNFRVIFIVFFDIVRVTN